MRDVQTRRAGRKGLDLARVSERPGPGNAADRDIPNLLSALLFIVRPTAIADSEVIIVHPVQLWVVKRTRSEMQKHPGMPGFSRPRKVNFRAIAAEETRLIAELCPLAGR